MAKKSSVAKKKSSPVAVKAPAKAAVAKSLAKPAAKGAKIKPAPVKSASKTVTKPVDKTPAKVKVPAVKAKVVEVAKAKATKEVKSAKQAPVKVALKSVTKSAKDVPTDKPAAKPELMSKKVAKAEPKVKDQGELLIEKAKEEMFKINGDAKQAEKASKVKPIKIERGNAADEKAKWQELNKRHGKEKAQVYKMTEVFEAMQPIQHKVLGWGFVLSNENNRLEVLFENGIKMLISNYKPS